MIEEIARVVAVDLKYAFVEVTKTSSCNSCNAKQACGTASISGLFRFKAPKIKIINSIDAKPGDQVIVALPENTMLTGSFMLYIVPLISMIIFAVGFDSLFGLFMLLETELVQVVGGLIGLIAGLLIVRRLSATFLSDTSMASLVKVTDSKPVSVSLRKFS